MASEHETSSDGGGVATADNPSDTLTVTDNRTGTSYEVEITDGTVRAMDLRQIKVTEDEFGMMSYDPAFLNTASCRSSITYIDGDAGILQHRGIPIEQLCEKSDFQEVAFTRTSSSSCRASATTPTRWGCCSPGSARSRPSTPTPSTSTIRRSATWRR
jgi:hypothetical protein